MRLLRAASSAWGRPLHLDFLSFFAFLRSTGGVCLHFIRGAIRNRTVFVSRLALKTCKTCVCMQHWKLWCLNYGVYPGCLSRAASEGPLRVGQSERSLAPRTVNRLEGPQDHTCEVQACSCSRGRALFHHDILTSSNHSSSHLQSSPATLSELDAKPLGGF